MHCAAGDVALPTTKAVTSKSGIITASTTSSSRTNAEIVTPSVSGTTGTTETLVTEQQNNDSEGQQVVQKLKEEGESVVPSDGTADKDEQGDCYLILFFCLACIH